MPWEATEWPQQCGRGGGIGQLPSKSSRTGTVNSSDESEGGFRCLLNDKGRWWMPTGRSPSCICGSFFASTQHPPFQLQTLLPPQLSLQQLLKADVNKAESYLEFLL